MSRTFPWLALAGSALMLNSLLTQNPAGATLWPVWTARISLELCVGVVLLAVFSGGDGPGPRRFARLLGVLCAGLIMVHLVDGLALSFFGRSFHPYWDGRHLGSVLALAQVPIFQAVAGTLALIALSLGLAALVVGCWSMLAGAFRQRGPRTVALCCCVALIGIRLADGAAPLVPLESWRWFSDPVSPRVLRQARLVLALARQDDGASQLAPSPVFASNVHALQGADVLLIFSESYGVCTLDDPAQAQALQAPRDVLAQAIAHSGRQVASARVRSPTFGGGSWLAHGALFSGIDTQDPLHYNLLLATQRPTLVQHFGAHGYRTVNWAPGLQRPWPEGQFFGFDRYVDAPTMGYRGLPFGSWRIPDQAAMALLHAQELAAPPATRAPRFVVFPTVNSHAPFHPLPPFVEDWARLMRADAYSAEQHAQALDSVASWRDPVPAYLQAIGLNWQWLGAYLRDLAPPGLVVILVGDHQPWAQVSGPAASWDVPIHVMSADAALLRRFEAAGFTPGLIPAGNAMGGMQALAPLLSSLFAAP